MLFKPASQQEKTWQECETLNLYLLHATGGISYLEQEFKAARHEITKLKAVIGSSNIAEQSQGPQVLC
jgi:hypothetical protein